MYNDNTPSWGRENMPLDRSTPSRMPDPETNGKARIKVIGVGGAGNNAINRMIDAGITSAEYIAVNTDAQILACNKAENKIQIGACLTKGLGAGADPEIGRAAAEEDKEALVKAVKNTDLLFITAGMGGGTGTGAAPVIAKIAKDMKILTVAVVTEPFSFEGKHRMDNTTKGLDNLRKYVDTLVIIPNEKIGDVVPRNAPMSEALRVADEVLKQGIRGIADLIVTPALINLDFADVKTVLKDKGLAHMGVGVAKGENRIVEAVRLAVNCPLLETTIEGATGVILNVVGGNDLTFDEVKLAANLIHSVVDYSANIIFGACIDENIRDEVEVTVIATGFPSAGMRDGRNGQNAQNAQNARGGQPRIQQPSYQTYMQQNQQELQPQRPANPVQGFGVQQPAYGQGMQQRPANPAQQPAFGQNFSTQPQRPAPTQPAYGQGIQQRPATPAQQPNFGQNFSAQSQRPAAPIQQTYGQGFGAQQRPTPTQGYNAQPQQPVYGAQSAQTGYNAAQPAQPNYGYQPQQPVYGAQPDYYAPQGYSQTPAAPFEAPQTVSPTAQQTRQAPAEDDFEDADFDSHDQRPLPDFVKKLIGKKKN